MNLLNSNIYICDDTRLDDTNVFESFDVLRGQLQRKTACYCLEGGRGRMYVAFPPRRV